MNNIKYGLNSNVSTLKAVLLKDPKAAFKSQKTIDLQWQNLNFIEKNQESLDEVAVEEENEEPSANKDDIDSIEDSEKVEV